MPAASPAGPVGRNLSEYVLASSALLELLAPLALLLPLPAAGEESKPADDGTEVPTSVKPAEEALPTAAPWIGMSPAEALGPWYQVRIQQRVIVRVSPRSPRQDLIATLPTRRAQDYIERKMGNCLPLKDIIAVQSDASRLLLYTRDRKIVAATLEKSCRPRDFYSGFYVEPRKDGKLCVDRDSLQSRMGTSCQVSRIRQLIPAGV